MAEAREWIKTLWRASYKGVPFFFEHDEEDGGRGLVVHEFPNRDFPFVEDLGENARYYSGAAYVHGDDADRQAAALIAVMAARGPGTLTVPILGPVLVHAQTFKRRHEKDRLGFVAFEVKFVREGFATSIVSLPFLANQAFVAAAGLATRISATFARSARLVDRADYVVAAAANGIATVAATLDVIRGSRAVEPLESARLRDVVSGIVFDAPEIITGQADTDDVEAFAATVVEATLDLAEAMTPESAASAMLEMADAFAVAAPAEFLSPSEKAAADNAAAAAQLGRLAALTAYSEAALRRTYSSRQEGITARGRIAERFDLEAEQAAARRMPSSTWPFRISAAALRNTCRA
jgi:hypothetical protein